MSDADQQRAVCTRFGAAFLAAPGDQRLAIAFSTLGQVPLNGLRHPPENDTCGWYIWGGETFSTELDFFGTMHVSHVPEFCPAALPYLGLAPGWRFLVAPGYADVWYDEKLLHV